jgi:DSF synthase
MLRPTSISARDPDQFPNWSFKYLDIEYDPETRAVWMIYKATAPLHFPIEMFQEIVSVRESLRRLFASKQKAKFPIRYFAIASNRPGVFALGGDLATFAAAIRRHDAAGLNAHATICVDIMYSLSAAFDLPIVTLSAVHGQCLGGGFEGALVTDFLIAESNAKLGLPEIAFNTFPGMGAVTLLTRRVGAALATQIISSGAVYSGADMYELDVVDVVAPPGAARETANEWMRENGDERWRRRRALTAARRLCFPIDHRELTLIVRQWVDCCLSVTENDLRHMERLAAAQKRLSHAQKGQTNAIGEPPPQRIGSDAYMRD